MPPGSEHMGLPVCSDRGSNDWRFQTSVGELPMASGAHRLVDDSPKLFGIPVIVAVFVRGAELRRIG